MIQWLWYTSLRHMKRYIGIPYPIGLTGALILYILCVPAIGYTQSNALVADLSLSNISINTDFNGTSVLLFGSVSGEAGDDIIVVISGPNSEIVTREKSKMTGIWVNSNSVKWKNAPSYYQIFTTRPLSQIATKSVLEELSVGAEFLDLRYDSEQALSPSSYLTWSKALHRNMQSASLWKINETSVQVMRGTLFRTQVSLPANITIGDYDVRIIHFRDGRFIAEDKTAIAVKKAGISAFIYKLAHEYSIFYGLFAVAFAVFAGWLAAAIFPKP